MKLTLHQQRELHGLLSEAAINEDTCHELYDHIVTALEDQKQMLAYDKESIQNLVYTEFKELVNTPSERRRYRRTNNAIGFMLFGLALLTYWLTMEPTVSFWDCGEFIAASYKLQVGHQPGAPLFLMIGRLFSLLAMGNTANIAYWINFSTAIASAATVMFLFWTITALGRRISGNVKLSKQAGSISAAGVTGALAFAFSDTFWFSAVEAEVYGLSSLFTAVTFWAVLKWERSESDKWLVFIAFVTGLSIGVHLLSLLTIPAVALVWYFKKANNISTIGVVKAFAGGCILVGLVQFVIIQYLVLGAAHTDLLFVNTLGLGFGAGAIFFIILIAIGVAWGIIYSIRKRKYRLHLSLLCLAFLLLGFSSYFMILIRANAKPAINLSNPDQPFSLYSYLSRENYGSVPLTYGNAFDARIVEYKETGNLYRKGHKRYEVSGHTYKAVSDRNMLFPRIYSQKAGHPEYYRQWLGLGENESPSFADNLKFFTSWQVGFMYWRYFLWNFAGRQNDMQSMGETWRGNWITGIKPLDTLRLGNQSDLPQSIVMNEAYNRYFALPLLLGIAGLIWLMRKNKYTALVVCTLFFFTGLAIILYLNQDPIQPRERDYAYVGSFYAFAIFIGFGLLAVKEFLESFFSSRWSVRVAAGICIMAVPVVMAFQGWNDHNRSGKTTARDWARNYLNSCAPNAILFTNADNDTYPLWYAQEVEGIRTDVRVICIQFLGDNAYINQLKKQLNGSAPLPVSLTEDRYAEGVRDYFPYVDYGIKDSVELKDLLAVLTSDDPADQVKMSDGSFMNFLPVRKLKLSVDPEQVILTGNVKEADRSKIVSSMEWEFKKDHATKSDLIMFDILASNNWKRPVYFATSVSDDTYLGLDKYLYLEGYAYHLLPFRSSDKDKTEQTNAEAMYSNIMNRMDYRGFKKAAYLDPESRRIINGTWDFNNTLVTNLLSEGKAEKADKVMAKCLRDLPQRNYSLADTLIRINTVNNLYALNHLTVANKITRDTVDFLTQELRYIASLSPEFKEANRGNIQMGLYVLDALNKLTAGYHQKELNNIIRSQFDSLVSDLS